MKYHLLNIFFVFGIIILVSIMLLALISFVYEENANIEETQTTITQVKLLDRHITIDNKYEILYSIEYSNGISVQVWKEVDFNDYIALWEENKYDENCFKN